MKIFFRLIKLPLFILIIFFIFIYGLNNIFKRYEFKKLKNIDNYEKLKIIKSFLNQEIWLNSKDNNDSKRIKFKISGNKDFIGMTGIIDKKIDLTMLIEENSIISENYQLIRMKNGKYDKNKNRIQFYSDECLVKNVFNMKLIILKKCDFNFLLQFNKEFKLSDLIIKSNECNIDINKSYKKENINNNIQGLEIEFYIFFSFLLLIFEILFLLKINKKIENNSLFGLKLSITCFALFSCLNLNLCLYNLLISMDDIKLSILFLILSLAYFIQFSFIILVIISKIVKLNINIYNENGNFNINFYILLMYFKWNLIIIVGFLITQTYFDTNYINYFWACLLLPQIIKLSLKNNRILNNFEDLNNYYVCKMIFLFYHKFFKYNFLNNNYNINWLSLYIFLGIIIFNLVFINLQFTFGVNFFLPKNLRNINDFDYFNNKEISNENIENDCVICMNPLKIINMEKWENILEDQLLIDYLNKKKNFIMITPCKHLFHSFCIVSWMNFKLECPYCRKPLPNIL